MFSSNQRGGEIFCFCFKGPELDPCSWACSQKSAAAKESLFQHCRVKNYSSLSLYVQTALISFVLQVERAVSGLSLCFQLTSKPWRDMFKKTILSWEVMELKSALSLSLSCKTKRNVSMYILCHTYILTGFLQNSHPLLHLVPFEFQLNQRIQQKWYEWKQPFEHQTKTREV